MKRKLLKTIKILAKISIIGILFLILAAVAVFAYFAKDLPDPEKLATQPLSQSTKIFDRTGQVLLYNIYGEEKRTIISLDNIPQHVIDTTLAIEDERFYSHLGVDLKAILRAAIANFQGKGISQGGSTITQQLIKNSILTPEKTYTRKIKEAILALTAEVRYSKDEILEMYMNQIPYGANAYGVEAAANTFFNKSARELSLAEAALIAALPKAPSYFSPYGVHTDELMARKNYILDRTANLKFISKEEAELAKQEKLTFNKLRQAIKAPHFIFFIRELLNEKYGEDFVQRAGLKVITTLDWDLQSLAEKLVQEKAEFNEKTYGASNAALVTINPKNGHILAMVGSRDYFDEEIDGNVNVTIRPRSPGSAIKPIVYATAFKKGFLDKTVIFDVPTDFPVEVPGEKPYQPQNYDNRFVGPVNFRQALAQSRNVPSVKVLYLAGVEDALNTARNLGITTLEDSSRYYLSFTLGGAEVKPLELASAYGVFAQDGILHNPASILRIEDANGEVLEEYQDESKRVMENQIARLVTDVLTDNEARTPVFGASSPLYFKERPVAAKTGTSQDYYDAWVVGYTPSLVTAVWVGNNNNDRLISREGAGVSAAGPLWHEFMAEALKTKPVETFLKPNPTETPKKLMLDGKWQSPDGQVHSILYYVNPEDPLGSPLLDPSQDRQFLSWEVGVQNWLKNSGQINPVSILPQNSFVSQLKVRIVSPVENQIITGDTIQILSEAESPNPIRQVEFFFDNRSMGTVFGSPFHLTTRIPEFQTYESGSYEIKVRVYDHAGRISETKRKVILEH